ncbi:MAG: peroxiredoxin family protein [Phycisphaerales bacterium]
MKPAVIIVAVLAAVGAFLFIGPKFSSAAAPDFTLYSGTHPVSLAQLRGRVVVIDFWASWCPPCRAAIPGMQKIHQDYAPYGVAVLGINVSDNKDPHEFMASMGANYAVLVDDGRVAKSYKVKGIPSFRVIGKDGTIRYSGSGWGGRTEADLRQAINDALAE